MAVLLTFPSFTLWEWGAGCDILLIFKPKLGDCQGRCLREIGFGPVKY